MNAKQLISIDADVKTLRKMVNEMEELAESVQGFSVLTQMKNVAIVDISEYARQ